MNKKSMFSYFPKTKGRTTHFEFILNTTVLTTGFLIRMCCNTKKEKNASGRPGLYKFQTGRLGFHRINLPAEQPMTKGLSISNAALHLAINNSGFTMHLNANARTWKLFGIHSKNYNNNINHFSYPL